MSHPSSIEERLAIINELLEILDEPMKNVSTLTWKPLDGFWTVVLRSVLVRQFEALQTIIDLVRSERAHLCVPLLRPAVEEFLWIAFLVTLKSEDREVFLFAKAQIETFETLQAQLNDAGAATMAKLGFSTEFLAAMKRANERETENLKELGKRLSWKLSKKPFPSTWFVAKHTGNDSLYALIYHATSRTVHFTASEYFRRGWGNADRLTISSKGMDQYWGEFSLYWGARIFALTFVTLMDEFDRLNIDMGFNENMEAIGVVIKKIRQSGIVPIITSEEMNLHPPGKS